MTRLALLLAFAVAACSSEPLPPPSTAERGAVHYHAAGGTALACTTWGFDTVCRGP